MSSNRNRNWKELADNVKQRMDKLIDRQLDLWSGKRERAKRAAEGKARQQQSEPPR